jgi:hypothetical protein
MARRLSILGRIVDNMEVCNRQSATATEPCQLPRCHPDGSQSEAEGSAVALLLRSTPNVRRAGFLVNCQEHQRLE